MNKKKIKIKWLSIALLYSSICVAQQNCDSVQRSLMEEVDRLQAVNAELMRELTIIYNKPEDSSSLKVEYRIQLATGDRSLISMTRPKTIILTVLGKMRTYAIKGFSHPQDAYALASDLRKLNLSEAFVTKYVNGVRDKSFRYKPILSNAENLLMSEPNTTPKVSVPKIVNMVIED